jgi:hypothetical protein
LASLFLFLSPWRLSRGFPSSPSPFSCEGSYSSTSSFYPSFPKGSSWIAMCA